MQPNYYLMTSSLFFLAPAIYGINRHHRMLPLVTLISTAASINYWYKPTPGTRRNIDIIVSKSCGAIYFLYGFYMIKCPQTMLLGYFNLFCILSSYKASCTTYDESDMWIPYHLLFHYFTAIGQFIVLS